MPCPRPWRMIRYFHSNVNRPKWTTLTFAGKGERDAAVNPQQKAWIIPPNFERRVPAAHNERKPSAFARGPSDLPRAVTTESRKWPKVDTTTFT